MTSTTKKKYVTKEVLEDFSLPQENQSILKVIKSRGNNLHEVKTSTGEEFLASMPPKFRKHIWIKRGDYVVSEPIPEGRKVKAEIVRILLKEQIKYFKDNNVWPEGFCDKSSEDTQEKAVQQISNGDDTDEEDDDILIHNPNKPVIYYESEESSSEEEEEDEDHDRDSDRSSVSAEESENGTSEGDNLSDGERDSHQDECGSHRGHTKLSESVTNKCKHLCI